MGQVEGVDRALHAGPGAGPGGQGRQVGRCGSGQVLATAQQVGELVVGPLPHVVGHRPCRGGRGRATGGGEGGHRTTVVASAETVQTLSHFPCHAQPCHAHSCQREEAPCRSPPDPPSPALPRGRRRPEQARTRRPRTPRPTRRPPRAARASPAEQRLRPRRPSRCPQRPARCPPPARRPPPGRTLPVSPPSGPPPGHVLPEARPDRSVPTAVGPWDRRRRAPGSGARRPRRPVG